VEILYENNESFSGWKEACSKKSSNEVEFIKLQ